MRFAHLSDSHLGYRQYGLNDREDDFYKVFNKTIDKIIDSDVDFVIHSGDLFENPRPTPRALFEFQNSFLRLKEENITVYAIAGNHDTVLRRGSLPPQMLFRKLGLNLLSKNNSSLKVGDVLICGIPFIPKTQNRVLLDFYKKFENEAENAEKSILVSHQGIDKYLSIGESFELKIGDLPTNFNYYAMGHIHNYINDPFGKGRLVYPGSMEIWRSDEITDYHANGKGFCIVDLSSEIPEVERVTVDLPRKFIRKDIDYAEIMDELKLIRAEIQELDEKPILELSIGNGNFNTSDVYELISDYLNDDALMIRPSYHQKNDGGTGKIHPGSINPRHMLKQVLDEKYGDEKISDLSVELLDNLSKNKIEEALITSDHYYAERYGEEEEQSNLDDY